MAGFLTGPGGAPVVFLAPTWSGDLAAGEAAVAPLTRLGTPLMTGIAPMPYPELLRMFEAGSAAGNQYALGTRWLAELTDDAITALVGGRDARPPRCRCWPCTSSTAPRRGSPRTPPPSLSAATICSPR